MKSYIPKQLKLTRERIEAKLEHCLVETLEKYCTYLDSDRDYVISQALEIAFSKDRGFAEWLKSKDDAVSFASAPKEPQAGARSEPVTPNQPGRTSSASAPLAKTGPLVK